MPTDATSLSSVLPATGTNLVSLEPVYNQLYSLMLLYKADRMPGLGEWVEKTREAMPLELLHRNRLVMEGLCYAFTTEGNVPSFGAYLDHLNAMTPESFQDRILGVYDATTFSGCSMRITPPEPTRRRAILSSFDAYFAFLQEHFTPPHLDPELEAQAYQYVLDPPALKAVVLEHLRKMWDSYLAPEWARIRPMLTRTVAAFRDVDLSGMTRDQAIRFVIGRDDAILHWGNQVEEAERIILAPSAHVGPYVGKFLSGRNLVILFGARLPEGAAKDEPDVSRTEILTGLDALADDHRLHILRMAADAGGVRATDVMAALDISQSAASRSLTQLTATGYLVESRRDGGKWYSINTERIGATLGALGRFLGVAGKEGTR